jgi:hypothetical protein
VEVDAKGVVDDLYVTGKGERFTQDRAGIVAAAGSSQARALSLL